MRRVILMAGVAGVAMLPAGAAAQSKGGQAAHGHAAAPAQDDSDEVPDDIVVTGSRAQPGAVIGDIPPEEQLGPADIRAYGVSTVADLLDELSPETQSGRGSGGAPVVLLNGRRISSFAEIRDLPTEAIARVDILPEEVALKYGYTADQRVVNIVLRPRFHAVTVEGGDTLATAGGRNGPAASLDVLHIKRDGRINIHLDYKSSDALLESQRDIIETPSDFTLAGNVVGTGADGEIDPALSAAAGAVVTIAGVPNTSPTFADFVGNAGMPTVYDQARYRTLLPSSHDVSGNVVWSRTILGNVSATLNGRFEATDSQAEQGLASVALAVPAGSPFSPFASNVIVDRALGAPYGALTQDRSEIDAHLGLSLNGDISPKWRWTFTSNYDRANSEAFTVTGFDATPLQTAIDAGTANPFGPIDPDNVRLSPVNQAYSLASTTEANALVTGTLFALPAGPVSTSIRAGGSLSDFSSRSVRGTTETTGQVSRDIANGQINLDVPITSRDKNVLGAIGSLSLNTNYAVDHLSDFGTLTSFGYGANWAPIPALRFLVSVTDKDSAPSAQQLGNPQVVTPNVRVFDYVNGETVAVTQVTGGNPDLLASNQRVTKIGMTLKPFGKTDFTFSANYITKSARNTSESLPSATAAIEAAFPDRFIRDDDGDLERIDSRPVNFAHSDSSELRWGFNLSLRLKSKLQKEFEAFRNGSGPNPLAGLFPRGARRGGFGGGDRRPDGTAAPNDAPPPAPGSPATGDQGNPPPAGQSAQAASPGAPPGGPPGAGGRGGFGGRGGGGFGGRGQAGGRLQFSLYHTWEFTDRVLIRDGLPELDLLNGGATGQGGQPRHQIQARAGYSNNGIGVRLNADWQSGTTVVGGTAMAPETLKFSSLGTFDIRLFADLTQQLKFIKTHAWARGMRITLGVGNLFDTRQRVTDPSGATPISYQPDYLDPLGRTVKLSIRKLFF
jgi:hypothetical protein